MRPTPIFAAALLALAGVATAAAPAVPVKVGDVPELDACVSWGVVTASKLAVRSGPGTRYAAIDAVDRAQGLHLCDVRGDWLGVVYVRGGGLADCGVSAPLPASAPYAGPCRSGWVHKARVQVAPR
jgi:hypothetical protein